MKKTDVLLNHSLESFSFSYLFTDAEPGATMLKRHVHSYYELMLIDEGEVEYAVENRQYVLKKGDVLLIKPAEYHYARRVFKSPYKRYCIGFAASFAFDERLPEKIFESCRHIFCGVDSMIFKLATVLYERLKSFELYDTVFCQSILNTLLISLDSEKSGTESELPNESSNFSRILNYVNTNLTSIASVEDISRQLYFSRSYIMHLFKSELRVGVMQYIRNKKILLAHLEIAKGKRPTEIFKECGFSNYTSFYRAYRAYFGFSPRGNKEN